MQFITVNCQHSGKMMFLTNHRIHRLRSKKDDSNDLILPGFLVIDNFPRMLRLSDDKVANVT